MTRDEYERRVAEIKTRYPYLFAGEHIGHDIAPGWTAILAELCARIDNALAPSERPRVHFSQIKEKFGGLRTYLNVAPIRIDIVNEGPGISGHLRESGAPHLFTRLAPFVRSAEEESYRTCLFCGAPGRLRRGDRSWVLTLCDRHAACGYHHLEAAFELMTDPERDPAPPTLDQLAATLLAARTQLRDLGARHIGLLPPVREGAPCRLVVVPAEREDLPVHDIAWSAAQLVGWPLDWAAIDWLGVYADRPTERDVTWVF